MAPELRPKPGLNRLELADLIDQLRDNLHEDPESWENPDLDRFLESWVHGPEIWTVGSITGANQSPKHHPGNCSATCCLPQEFMSRPRNAVLPLAAARGNTVSSWQFGTWPTSLLIRWTFC